LPSCILLHVFIEFDILSVDIVDISLSELTYHSSLAISILIWIPRSFVLLRLQSATYLITSVKLL
jgi:hypothetical protein